jgi:hypothetical protein
MLVAYGKRAIDGTLEVWLPRLVESNDALEQGLRFVRDPGPTSSGWAPNWASTRWSCFE